MVGGEDGDHGFGILEIDPGRRQDERRGGVPGPRLDERFRREPRQEPADRPGLGGVGDGEDSPGGNERADPADGLLEHRPLADDRKELLGPLFRLSGQNRVPLPPAMMTAWRSEIGAGHDFSNFWMARSTAALISSGSPPGPLRSRPRSAGRGRPGCWTPGRGPSPSG